MLLLGSHAETVNRQVQGHGSSIFARSPSTPSSSPLPLLLPHAHNERTAAETAEIAISQPSLPPLSSRLDAPVRTVETTEAVRTAVAAVEAAMKAVAVADEHAES